jgi:XTP/dITP diphosphohydrolase
MQEIVVATSNGGKLREFAALLAPVGLRLHAQSAFGVASAEETGASFIENAIIKARHAAAATGLPALADDSGLAVDALDGEPGIHSARFAGPGADDAANNRRLLERLAGVPPERRGARFHCVLVLMRHARDPVPLGRILEAPRGEHGFGYDPLFLDPALGRSAAELEPALKNRLSHRARALEALLRALDSRC